MAFSVEDVQDLIRLLAQHPEWRAELRPLILGDEILALPAALERLTAAQERTEASLARLDARVEELAQAQARTETRIEELAQVQARTEARVEELAQAQARTETRIEELAQAQARTEDRLDRLVEAVAELAASVRELAGEQHRVSDRLGTVDGRWLEQRFYDRAPSYFGPYIRKPRVVELPDIGVDDALADGRITKPEYEQLPSLDVLVEGRDRRNGDDRAVLLAVEVPVQIRDGDVTRALQRAAILERLGFRVIPTVAGESIGPAARQMAEAKDVLIHLVSRD